MPERWEEVFNKIAWSISTIVYESPPSEAQMECTRGWMRSMHIDAQIHSLITCHGCNFCGPNSPGR